MSIDAISIIVTILLVFSGYFITHWAEIQIARRKEQLDLVEKRINEFYGPLYVTSLAGQTAYQTLLKKLGRDSVFEDSTLSNEVELTEWRIWTEKVFAPLHDYQEKLIFENAHLLTDESIPDTLIVFTTHVSAFKVIISKWEQGDFSEYTPELDFPEDLLNYAQSTYSELKREQLRLIGKSQN